MVAGRRPLFARDMQERRFSSPGTPAKETLPTCYSTAPVDPKTISKALLQAMTCPSLQIWEMFRLTRSAAHEHLTLSGSIPLSSIQSLRKLHACNRTTLTQY